MFEGEVRRRGFPEPALPLPLLSMSLVPLVLSSRDQPSSILPPKRQKRAGNCQAGEHGPGGDPRRRDAKTEISETGDPAIRLGGGGTYLPKEPIKSPKRKEPSGLLGGSQKVEVGCFLVSQG